MPDPREAALIRLKADGLVAFRDGRLRTTRRWQGAMARAALRLISAGDQGADLRVPVASALAELYGDELDDEGIVRLLAVMTPIEHDELVIRPPGGLRRRTRPPAAP